MKMEAPSVGRPRPSASHGRARAPGGPDVSATNETIGVSGALSRLLEVESAARRAATVSDLDVLVVNEARALLRARQTVLLDGAAGSWRAIAVSNVGQLDRSGPFAQWVEAIAARLARDVDAGQPHDFALPAYSDPDASLTRDYPFRHVFWLPLWSPVPSDRFALVLMRERPWIEADRKIGVHVAETFGHARALRTALHGPFQRISAFRPAWLIAAAVALAASLWPVSLSVLAPVEVVPRDAEVIAMPMDGIVEKVLVRPSESVAKGQPLLRLVDTQTRNKLEIAAREVAVAEARVERASSLAFSDGRGRQEIGIARAELQLKLAEHAYAKDVFEANTIRATTAGVALFSDPKDLEGKPATTGQRLMLVARPGETELRIEIPVADSIVLRTGLPVRAFLDADPLAPVEGEIRNIDHKARVSDGGIASYQVTARLLENTGSLPLGGHGTAQIRGPKTPLVVFLLRRPINAVRQWIGL